MQNRASLERHEYFWLVPLPEPLPAISSALITDDNIAMPPWRGCAEISLLVTNSSHPWPLVKTSDELFALAEQLHPEIARPERQRLPGITSDMTIVEISAMFKRRGVSEADISDAFDRGLEMIQAMQRAYYLASKDAISGIAREPLPNLIPMLQRHGTASKPGALTGGVFLPHLATMRTVHPPIERLDDSLFAAMRGVMAHADPGGAFWAYADLRREAQVLLAMRGDYRGAVITAATAAEVFLDTLLLHLLWHDGSTEEEAAKAFSTGLTYRVKSEYSGLIRGRWSLVGSNPVARWHRSTATMRNRVAHAGYRPSLVDAQHAVAAAQELETYLVDLVCAPPTLTKYIGTALEVAGIPGLERRDRYSRKVRELAEAVSREHLEAFHSWKSRVDELRTP